MSVIEHSYDCPFCGAEVSALLDPSISRQSYIEDCEVCCRPMRFSLVFENWDLVEFEVHALEQ